MSAQNAIERLENLTRWADTEESDDYDKGYVAAMEQALQILKSEGVGW